ncbi:MAG: glycogen/starch/alpha-glucan phosphorylase [Oscillospiraceae bacterium]|nr:glycogen/starch/alpha-glucan phosphorylase [Oscillospiraceae bacterium]
MAKFNNSDFESDVVRKLNAIFNENPEEASVDHIYEATAAVCRDRLDEQRTRYKARTYGQGAKEVFYLSIEYLIGRSLKNNLFNMGLLDEARKCFKKWGTSSSKVFAAEPDAGLGNGGLGRLAASYLDSLATENYPTCGYGLMYEYGIFKQQIIDGWQQELPDNWMSGGRVWLKERREEAFEVRFGGHIEELWDGSYHHVRHTDYDSVIAVPYDMFISGYNTNAVTKLRLWRAEAASIDMDSFNRGDYTAALKRSESAQLISKVLYPNDNHREGKILRLKQQYFLCSASVNDIVQKHLAQYGTLTNLPDKVAIHINDTHPTLAIPELMRVLLDDCGLGWDQSLAIAKKVFSYTNHTVLAEALEQWDADIFNSVCPRCYQIIQEIDKSLARELDRACPGDWGKQSYMRIISGNRVRMANLCVYISHSVNGVSKLHSELLKQTLFSDYNSIYPEKFKNVTNGVSYRRWIIQGNTPLSELLDKTIGKGYRKDPSQLVELNDYADDKEFLDALMEVKRQNKAHLIEKYAGNMEHPYNPDSLFDVQAKRMHEYKRQHLNALHILSQYLYLKDNPGADFTPRTYIFGAKAAPGYFFAKQMIRFLCGIADLLEQDPDVNNRLRVLFLEDYRISVAEDLMPAADISEQISLAGYEASGTGCMKLIYNGAITLGTLDGANIEIKEAVGADNFFEFGMNADDVMRLKSSYRPMDYYNSNPDLKHVIDFIDAGFANQRFDEIVNNLKHQDPYMVLADYESYCKIQKQVGECYKDKYAFAKKSLANIANAGIFSSDRAVKEYADNIWHMKQVK